MRGLHRAVVLLTGLLAGCAQQVVVFPDGSSPADATPGQDASAPASDAASADAGVDPADAGSPPDALAPDAGPNDAGGPACFVDPFSVCPDPGEDERRNDDWTSAARFHTTSVGCLTGDDISPLMGVQAGVLCHDEPADYYALTIIPCDVRTLRLQVRLRPMTECPADKYELELRFGGGRRECGTELNDQIVQCSEEGMDRLIQVLVPPGNSVQSWYFAVLSDFTDVRFDYELEVTVQ